MAGLNTEKWRVLDFTGFTGKVKAERGAIAIINDDGSETNVPVADVAVALFGVNTRFSAGSMHRLLGNGTAVIYCDWKGTPIGAAAPWADHTRVGARQIAQANASLPKRKAAWAKIVKAKVLGQAAVLEYCDRDGAKLLRSMAKRIASGDSSNIEGQSARAYWKHLFAGKDFKRLPGVADSESPENSLLNYGYTILRGHAMRAVVAAGLSPALGIFHRGRSNAFNLADDLIEPFRPAIDACAASLLSNSNIDSSATRAALVAAAGDTFGLSGNSIPAELTALAQRYGQYLEGNLAKLEVAHWSPTLALGLSDAE